MNIQRLSQSHYRRLFGDYYRKVLGYGPIAYWPLWEPSGSVASCLINSAQNGSHTGVTLGQTGIGDRRTCPLFDGINDWINIHSATLAGVLNGSEGTVHWWSVVDSASMWTDGKAYYAFHFRVDGSNYLNAYIRSGAAGMGANYVAGGTVEFVTGSLTATPDWVPQAITWSKSGDAVRYYWNKSLSSSAGILGTWAGSLVTASIGSADGVPTTPWKGRIAHLSVFDEALEFQDVVDLGTL